MKIGIYNRYWNTMGGGEKYVGTMAEALLERHEVELICVEPVNDERLCSRLNLDLSGAKWVEWPSLACADLAPRTRDYDLFINATYCSSMVPQSPRSAYVIFFPHALKTAFSGWFGQVLIGSLRRFVSIRAPIERDAECYEEKSQNRVRGALNRFRLRAVRVLDRWGRLPFIGSYQARIVISSYSNAWMDKRWNTTGELLTPPINTAYFVTPSENKKQPVILSVGRFFSGGHNKKHLEMISAFRGMYDRGEIPVGWEYHLVGNVHRENGEHRDYFEKVLELAQGYPIKILNDLSSETLLAEYHSASIFWHASGWGEDVDRHPERFEHFGITTCEAMAAGVIPIVIARAGQLEIVQDGENGFLFEDENELVQKTLVLIGKFGSDEFEKMVKKAEKSAWGYDRSLFVDRLGEIMDDKFQMRI